MSKDPIKRYEVDRNPDTGRTGLAYSYRPGDTGLKFASFVIGVKHSALFKLASKQSRHSCPNMTLQRYAHSAIEAKGKAVNHLPVCEDGFWARPKRKTAAVFAGVFAFSGSSRHNSQAAITA